MEWISVEDRLPEFGQDCIFLIPTSIPFMACGYVAGSASRFKDCSICDQYGEKIGYDADCITHWIPLPEPPNG